MFENVLIAIIADPIAPVYSFQARRPPTRMPRGLSHGCNNFNAATAASFNHVYNLANVGLVGTPSTRSECASENQ